MADEKKQEKKEETKEDKKEKIPSKFKSIVEEIEKMSAIDLSELVKILEEKFNVSAQAPVAMAGPAVAAVGEEDDKEEQTSFNVELIEVGESKISVIKAIREFVSIGLKEAKDLTDNVPAVVKEGANKEDADKMKETLEKAGAKVALK